MCAGLEIRASDAGDLPALERLYRQTFPDEDLFPLVRELLDERADVVSLVAAADGSVAGHVVFTSCRVDGSPAGVALLGPLAVAPACQRRGVGGALVRAGFARLREAGVTALCVLGDPGYYARFGFMEETQIVPPYPLVAEWRTAWQGMRLGDPACTCSGRLIVPGPWQRPALWAP
ncbi:MAG: N-acetyltransferase [Hyphomicrobiaceae bacterium]|nr:N-acetyltransferase [Hyphomicrobiaceae bacterium]